MKICLIGSASSSISLAPYNDPNWSIWGCSPGAYYLCTRSEFWFETHRWEPPVVGAPSAQKPWFSPEYVAWLYKHPCVWGFDLPKDMPGAKVIPHDALRKKYGDFFFTSSLAWMFGMAIDTIQEARERGDTGEHTIALYGVDMAAQSEYGLQRSGCQYFGQIWRSRAVQSVFSRSRASAVSRSCRLLSYSC